MLLMLLLLPLLISDPADRIIELTPNQKAMTTDYLLPR